MIEVTRYILAAMVAQTHLWPRQGMGWTGQVPVFAFYTLSGYLMTRVLNDRYGFTKSGIVAFLLNRVLRLWPAYLVTFALVLFALRFLPLGNFFFLIRIPQNAADIITNATIIGQVGFDFRQWVPLAKPLVTSWSLSIEIFCYVMLALYFAKSPARLWTFAVLGIVGIGMSTTWCAFSDNPAFYGDYCFQNRYGVLQAGFIPFACGGLYYFHRKTVARWFTQYRAISSCLLALALAAMFVGPIVSATIGTFIGIPVMWMLLANIEGRRPARVQDFVGRASYHLFIAHMPVAAVLVTGLGLSANTPIVYIATMVTALGLSAFLVPMEWRINRMRQQIAAATQEPAGLADLSPPASPN